MGVTATGDEAVSPCCVGRPRPMAGGEGEDGERTCIRVTKIVFVSLYSSRASVRMREPKL